MRGGGREFPGGDSVWKGGRRKKGAEMKKAAREGCLLKSGAGNRSRTYDLRITNALLYQLSYAGKTICFVPAMLEPQAKHLDFPRLLALIYGVRSGKTEIISEFFGDGKPCAQNTGKTQRFAQSVFLVHNLVS